MMAYTWIVFKIFMFLFPLCSLAQSNGTVAIGSILTADEASRPWLSPSEDFAFGFKQLQDKDQFLFSIWFNKIPDKTVVWYLNSIDSSVPRGSSIELHAQTGLILRDPQGQELWRSDGNFNQVDHGFLNDTGNFILKGNNDDRSWLWESFGFPSDTILPSQELSVGMFLNSRKSETNFSGGRFYLRFRNDGNLVLTSQIVPTNTKEDALYYESQTGADPNDSLNSGYRVIFDSRGSMVILKRNNDTKQLSPASIPSASVNYHRARLDFDGVFTHYYHPKTFSNGNPEWTVLWSIPDNICLSLIGDNGSGACGFNNICSLGNRRPVCNCPQGYNLVDPNDKYGSCMPNSTLSCDEFEQGSSADLYGLVKRNDVDWPKSDYEQINPAKEIDCRQFCLEDCFCAVAVFRSNSCWKKKLPLSNGKVDTTLNSVAFIKYRKNSVPPPVNNTGLPGGSTVNNTGLPGGSTVNNTGLPGGSTVNNTGLPGGSKSKDRGTLILVESVLLGSSLFVNFVLIGFYLIYHKRKETFLPNSAAMETNLHCFTFKELTEATNGFKEELGRGSYGIVYKGELTMSSRSFSVAVKKLTRLPQDAEKEFRAEVNSIGQTNHKNLVRLLGFCYEGQHRLLVYEYMSNGNLASFLFSKNKPSWNLRTQIAIGIARGLVYLHEECSTKIIHCDIKPQNVLLDAYYNAHIADFGLAKLLAMNESRASLTNVRGTKGYVAPEWFRNAQITAKVDVYSFGVLLLEIISCRRSVKDIESGEVADSAILTDFVWDCFQENRLDTFVQNDVEALNDKMILERFVKVGIWCIQEIQSQRPTMRKVSQMLEGIVEVILPPCPYPFSTTTFN